MWELQLANPFGSLSVRKLLTFVAATLVTIVSYLLLNSTPAYAADATWEQGSISYNGETYRGPTEPTSGHNLPNGSILYTFLGPQVPFSSQTMRVIYFPPGTDTANATTANHVTYERGATGGLSNKSSPTEISFDATTLPESQEAANASTSSCKLDGIGWIICPITTALATGMDWIFDIISGYLKVRPLDTVTAPNNTMFKTWEVMRNFANVVFVVMFLIVIYSQLTSIGISNYGIKKIVPRLIIASILVNISYWICAVGIDLSNILGYSFQDLFINLRNNILGSNGNSWDLISWESVSAFVLSGGAIAGAAIVGVTAMTATLAGAFTVGGVALLLAPILLGAFLTVMVVLIILAARQAIITLLVVIAPLAFVAYLLPNTEKLFDKWRGLFMTMLIMFPAFSLVFGGSQLAGSLIIQNAKDINVVLFGMAVQIAPLAITPLLFKLSGSLLGRIAGIVNNPSKGVLDRTKNWSKDRLDARRAAEMKKNRSLAAAGQLGKRNFSRRAALRFDNQKRLREGMKHINETDGNSLFAGSQQGHLLHEAEHVSNQLKERIETEANVILKAKINTEGSKLHLDNIDVELAKIQLKDQEVVTERQIANYRTEAYLREHLNPAFGNETIQSIAALKHYDSKIAIESLAAQSAKRVTSSELADSLKRNSALRSEAAGIDNINGRGEIRILSEVKSQIEAEKDTLVKNIKIASDIKPGDADGLAREFEEAVRHGDAEGMRAYADLLVEAANPGVERLRKVIHRTESIMPVDAMEQLKAHINKSGPINGAAEDIASWSRDDMSRPISSISSDSNTWKGLTANSFSGMKKSSQEAALRVNGISQKTAAAILAGPVFQNLKPDIQERIEKRANGDPTYNDGISDPFI